MNYHADFDPRLIGERRCFIGRGPRDSSLQCDGGDLSW